MTQSTSNILLVRPASFSFNNETSISNAFQNNISIENNLVQQKAITEFDNLAEILKNKGVEVLIINDTDFPKKPDAVFPNNWISFHENGTIILYPMHATNRRHERRPDIIEKIRNRFIVKNIIDLSHYENENKFLEGTGSIIFDHSNKIAYACLSPRTDKDLFVEVCKLLNYSPIYFYAHDKNEKEIYHTNVMMCIAEKFAVICLESITNKNERELVIKSLTKTNHQIIEINFEQMNHFAGNMLTLKNDNKKNILVLSKSAFNILIENQKKEIEKYCELIPLSIDTIETIGGGSARCMIAEIFLPPKK